MYAISDEAEWVESVHGWDVDDPVEGGVGGADNVPLTELAKRTAYLKGEIGAVGEVLDALNGEEVEDEEDDNE
jgi:hypothetical protein